MATTTSPARPDRPARPDQAAAPGAPARTSFTAWRAVVARAVVDRVGFAAVGAVLLIAMGLLVGALWPSLQGTFTDLEDQLPEAFDALLGGASLSTPTGWASAQTLSIVAPAVVIAVAALTAGQAVAGDEEKGSLGVLLAAPVGRTALLTAQSLAATVHVLVVGAGLVAGLLLGSWLGDMGLAVGGILGAAAHVSALGVLFVAITLLAAAITGRWRPTAAIAGVVAVVSFLAATFLPLVDAVSGLARLSPWTYLDSGTVLDDGIDAVHVLGLLGAAAVVLAGAVAVLHRRDLRG